MTLENIDKKLQNRTKNWKEILSDNDVWALNWVISEGYTPPGGSGMGIM